MAARGVRPVVLEAAAVGWGGSGRNNGQVIPVLSKAEPDELEARFGETGERLVALIRDSASILFDLVRAEGIEAEAEQTGWVQPAHAPDRVRVSAARVEAWAKRGAPAQMLDREETTALMGSSYWHGAMLNPTGGSINPLRLAQGMAAAAERHGATVHEDTPVSRLERAGDGWRLETPTGRLTARAVLLATNAYTDAHAPGLARRLARTVVPVPSWQMATEPLPDAVAKTVTPGRHAVSDTRGDLHFFRLDARNRLVTGGALVTKVNGTERIRRLATARVARMFPQIGPVGFTHIWNGDIGITWDRMPHVHRLGPGLWTWIGCNGRGVALSVALGPQLAAALLGDREGAAALPVTDVHPIPGHALGRRLATLMLPVYRRRDRRPLPA
nr:FAD-dependent oxidoreductase [Roseospira navarrensis]